MLVSQLTGGLGNQMFQYANVLSLANRFGVPFSLDLRYLEQRTGRGHLFVFRDYDLDVFEINPSFEIPENLFGYREPSFRWSEDVALFVLNNLEKNIHLLGQYQSAKYFNENLVRESLSFRNKIENSTMNVINMKKKIENCNSVMLNVRRTDFTRKNHYGVYFHGVLENDYINSAVEIINSKVENPHYFVFSDDIEWCRENIKLEKMTIVEHELKGPKFSHYLQLMISCKHFIIPNSTFAWWAAWLNQNTEKIVIGPKKWFNVDDIDTSDILPDNWIKI